jgi:DNA-3-methyladenine glycosylase
MSKILKRKFYNHNTVDVARDLIGCFLARGYRGKIIKAMITETEAYRGEYDLACHASKGRTKRTEIMYGRSGHAYVYMIYGMYFMLNIVTEEKDFPAAVLIRGVKIKNPSLFNKEGVRLDGPGKLTKFLHIDKSLDGHDLTKEKNLWLEYPENKKRLKIIKSPRVGVDYAKHFHPPLYQVYF